MGTMTKKYTMFRPKIRTRHPSHSILRKKGIFKLLPFRSVIRLGSTTELPDTIENGGNRIELNTVTAVKNSSNKLKMKACFADLDVKTADWYRAKSTTEFYVGKVEKPEIVKVDDLPYPIVSKHIYGSRGRGNKKHDTKEAFKEWLQGKDLRNYIFEKFYNFSREYRLHVTKEGCFYTCRKMLKQDTPQEDRWFRNDSNCVWILEENPQFDKPTNWSDIIKESVRALTAVGLDFGGVDVRVQSATTKKGNKRKEAPQFIIIEINSAPSFGEITGEKYLEMLPDLLVKKEKGIIA